MATTPTIGIVGKGALGLLYASRAQEALGNDNVFFAMDERRLARHANDTYTINGKQRVFRDVDAAHAPQADAVIVAVKSTGLASALDTMEPLVGESTVIIPVLNGITSERTCAKRYGWERVVTCVALGMDAARFGSKLEFSQFGRLQLGISPDTPRETLDRAIAILTAANIDNETPADIVHAQWVKFMANVGVNQTCAVFQMTYEQLFADQTSEAFRTFIGAMREVAAIGQASGVRLTEEDLGSYIGVLQSLDPKSTPSMAQDRINRNRSEVDEFAGEVIRRAETYGIWTPCNRFLFNQVRAYEAEF